MSDNNFFERYRVANLIIIFIAVMLVGFDPVYQSQVNGNVPSAENFDHFLSRDLTAYFQKDKGATVTVRYELLRPYPTQLGVGSPKYYLWIKVYDGVKLINEGAVKVAAIEKIEFEILRFMPLQQIRTDPSQVDRLFPKALADDIRSRAGVHS